MNHNTKYPLVHISRFRGGYRDTTPVEGSLPWPELYQHLTTPKLAGNGKLTTPGISLVQYGDVKRRSNENVKWLYGLGYDVDNAIPGSGQKIQVADPFLPEHLGLLGVDELAHCWHTTYSSRPDWIRWRLFILLSQRVSPGEFRYLHGQVAREYGFDSFVDRAVKDVSRLFFEFHVPNLEYALSGGNVEGVPLDPADYTDFSEWTEKEAAADTFEAFDANQGEEDIEKIGALLEKLDPTCDRDRWLRIGMAIHHEMNGSGEGLALWNEWSSKGENYAGDADVEKRWDSFTERKGRPVTLGSLVEMVRETEPDWSYQREGLAGDLLNESERGVKPCSLDDLISAYQLTDEDVKGIVETEFIYEQMIATGHLMVVVGSPGVGKTTVLEAIAASVSAAGKRVIFINADIAAGDMPEALRRSRAGGYVLLCPDIKKGGSMAEVVKLLRGMAASGEDLSDVLFIVDTLKKTADMIQKESLRGVLQLFRKLTAQGASVLPLAHTNKYKDKDGWPIFEGTGDLQSDVDELVLLHSARQGDQQIVSLFWKEQGWESGKARCAVKPLSWAIDLSEDEFGRRRRQVRLLDEWVDTREIVERKQEMVSVNEIKRILRAHPDGINKTQVWTYADQDKCSRRECAQLLDKYEDIYWTIEKGERRALLVFLKEENGKKNIPSQSIEDEILG